MTAATMTSKQPSSDSIYYFVPDLQALDSSAREMPLDDSHTWVQPTVIDDEDLTFGGKSLSTLYEEERRRLSSGSASGSDEERRGRERVRSGHAHGHGSHHKGRKN